MQVLPQKGDLFLTIFDSHAVKVVRLVLEYPCQKPLGFEFQLIAGQVQCF
jgi:hypothetical protein